jgi:hypothetical protein
VSTELTKNIKYPIIIDIISSIKILKSIVYFMEARDIVDADADADPDVEEKKGDCCQNIFKLFQHVNVR